MQCEEGPEDPAECGYKREPGNTRLLLILIRKSLPKRARRVIVRGSCSPLTSTPALSPPPPTHLPWRADAPHGACLELSTRYANRVREPPSRTPVLSHLLDTLPLPALALAKAI